MLYITTPPPPPPPEICGPNGRTAAPHHGPFERLPGNISAHVPHLKLSLNKSPSWWEGLVRVPEMLEGHGRELKTADW